MTDTLAAALARVQSALPRIAKSETARVETKGGGSYSYAYAGLADISSQVLPLLGQVGLSWICRPTMIDDQFVLRYELRHTSGEEVGGIYPLPDPARSTPQQVGSAITYARRYCLCAVVGITPDDEDDDGRAASSAPAATRPVDLAPLEALIAEAGRRGVQVDADAAQRYAARSESHLQAAISRLRRRIDETSDATEPGDDDGAHEPPPEVASESGEGMPAGASSPDPAWPERWRTRAEARHVKTADMIARLRAAWPADHPESPPNNSGGIDRLPADLYQIVLDAIDRAGAKDG